MPAKRINLTDRKAAAVIVGLLDGPNKTEKQMLELVACELVRFRTVFGAHGDPVQGKESVDWAALLSLRCVLRSIEKVTAQIKYFASCGLPLEEEIGKLEKHTASALQLAKDIKEA